MPTVYRATASLWSWQPQDTYLLPLLNFCEHNNGVALPFPHHPPEILHRVRKRSLGGNEVILLAIALRRKSRIRLCRDMRAEVTEGDGGRGDRHFNWCFPSAPLLDNMMGTANLVMLSPPHSCSLPETQEKIPQIHNPELYFMTFYSHG